MIPFRRVFGAAARGVLGFAKRIRSSIKDIGLFRTAAKGIGGAMRGILGIIPALGAGIAAAIGIGVSALGGMREALEGTEDDAGAAGEAAKDSADDFSDAADVTEKAAETAKIAFGAFGDVGAGFVMKQGSITEAATKSADAAAKSAQVAGGALKDTAKDLGDSTKATTRFGKALDRIGKQFDIVKKKLFTAIAKSITPALEKLADLMESETFQKFVDLLAKDLAEAIDKVADWIVDKAIPALEDWMEEVNEAGGTVEWFEGKWRELRNTVSMILAIMLFRAVAWAKGIKKNFLIGLNAVLDFIGGIALSIGNFLLGVGNEVKTWVDSLPAMFAGVGQAIADAMRQAFNLLLKAFPWIQDLIDLIGGGGGPKKKSAPFRGDDTARRPPDPDFPSSGGDGRQGSLDGRTVNIYVTVPRDTPDPDAFGVSVGDGIVMALRRSGQRIPTI